LTRLRFVVKGRVQGVGFRWFVVEKAHALGLTGWVKNRPDGAVEGEAQGEGTDQLVEALRQGPSLSRVDVVDIAKIPSRGDESGFEVI
jgi:acylphosphatase